MLTGGRFVEVFLGPNAPLSAAICRQLEIPLPGARVATTKGVYNELQQLADVMTEEAATLPPSWRQPSVESNPYRLAGVEAGRQPGYGGRTQLIADGLNDELAHLERALTLSHPFRQQESLKPDHRDALDRPSRLPEVANIGSVSRPSPPGGASPSVRRLSLCRRNTSCSLPGPPSGSVASRAPPSWSSWGRRTAWRTPQCRYSVSEAYRS